MSVKEYELRPLVTTAEPTKDAVPYIFGVAKHPSDEFALRIRRLMRSWPRHRRLHRFGLHTWSSAPAQQAQHIEGILAQQQTDHDDDDDGAPAEAHWTAEADS